MQLGSTNRGTQPAFARFRISSLAVLRRRVDQCRLPLLDLRDRLLKRRLSTPVFGYPPSRWLSKRPFESSARLLGVRLRLNWLRRSGTEGSSRDRYPTVDRQNLARDHARFVTSEIKRRAGDVAGFDRAEQTRVGKPRQSGVSGSIYFTGICRGCGSRRLFDQFWRPFPRGCWLHRPDLEVSAAPVSCPCSRRRLSSCWSISAPGRSA